MHLIVSERLSLIHTKTFDNFWDTVVPCRPCNCNNRPSPFTGQTVYTTTKPGFCVVVSFDVLMHVCFCCIRFSIFSPWLVGKERLWNHVFFCQMGLMTCQSDLTLFGDTCRRSSLPEEVEIHRVKWRHSNLWSLCCGTTWHAVWS